VTGQVGSSPSHFDYDVLNVETEHGCGNCDAVLMDSKRIQPPAACIRRAFAAHSLRIDFQPAGNPSSENHQKPLYFDGFLWKTIENHCILIHFAEEINR